jgi:uncharacterized protein YjdB
MSTAGSYVIEVDLTDVTPTANYMFASVPAATGILRVETPAPSIVPVSGVSLNVSYKEMAVGEIFQLEASVTPSYATNQTVLWSTSNSATATVSAGRVTAIAPGSTTITATTEDGGYTASCTIVVGDNSVGAEEVSQHVSVSFSESALFVNSPSDEIIAVYSFNGQLLLLEKKPQGEASFILANRIGEKAVIVTGSSGWTKKVAR